MKRIWITALLLTAGIAAAGAQGGTQAAKPAAKPDAAAATPPDPSQAPDVGATTQPLVSNGPMILLLRGLDKITGRPTDIVAPINKPVHFATLTITARYCYSTPASETPETAAFVQIDDHRPDQPEKRIFSGWMYASSPGLNGMEHPLYDVWVINCNNGVSNNDAANAAAPVAVAPPDSSDK